MTEAIKLIINYIWAFFDTVNDALVFELFDIQVHFLSLIISIIVLVMCVSVFWKGAKG